MAKRFDEYQRENLSDLGVWKQACDCILEQEFPPTASSATFPAQTLQRDAEVDLSKMSNWTLVCEEILDTEFSPIYYQRCYDELLRRGMTADEIREMRQLAWMTAGWLNYAKMLWDWTNLDETDIGRAIDWQFEDQAITSEKRDSMILLLEKYKG